MYKGVTDWNCSVASVTSPVFCDWYKLNMAETFESLNIEYTGGPSIYKENYESKSCFVTSIVNEN